MVGQNRSMCKLGYSLIGGLRGSKASVSEGGHNGEGWVEAKRGRGEGERMGKG